MKHGSLFAGIGGFDLGFERAGIETIWTVENDKNCNAILEAYWPDVKRHGDVREVRRHNLEPVDIISGGFPCQDLSVAGRRKGLAGERSGLWFEFARIVDEMEAQWVVVENVPGLLSSDGGRDFAQIVQTLEQFGYCVAWRVLDSQYFGVPQRRRRVFLVGSLGNGSAIEVLFEADGELPSPMEGRLVLYNLTARSQVDDSGGRARQLVIGTLKAAGVDTMSGVGYIMEEAPWTEARSCPESGESIPSLNSLFGDCSGKPDTPDIGSIGGNSKSTLPTPEGRSPYSSIPASGMGAQTTSDCPRPMPVIGRPRSSGTRKGTLRPLDPSRPEDGELLESGAMSLRTFTPTECERLQGFPDGWTEGLSDMQRYKTLGNAVTVNVAEWIGRRLMELAT